MVISATRAELHVDAEVDDAGQHGVGDPAQAAVVVPGAVGLLDPRHGGQGGGRPPRVNTIVGPYDDVIVPRGSVRTDWEVELAVVIGTRARYLDSPEQALAHVAGLCLSNDVSERDFQLEVSGGQWSKGKCCETFNPLGPWLRPLDEVADVQDLGLRSWVDGRPRQDSSTRDMLFGVAALVHELSQYLVLEPGDVINTGTPEGVALSGRFPYLSVGDVVELEIDGLGRQRQVLIADAKL